MLLIHSNPHPTPTSHNNNSLKVLLNTQENNEFNLKHIDFTLKKFHPMLNPLLKFCRQHSI